MARFGTTFKYAIYTGAVWVFLTIWCTGTLVGLIQEPEKFVLVPLILLVLTPIVGIFVYTNRQFRRDHDAAIMNFLKSVVTQLEEEERRRIRREKAGLDPLPVGAPPKQPSTTPSNNSNPALQSFWRSLGTLEVCALAFFVIWTIIWCIRFSFMGADILGVGFFLAAAWVGLPLYIFWKRYRYYKGD